MIGANREAMTRAFGLPRKLAALEVYRRLVRITDMEALERAAVSQWRRQSAIDRGGFDMTHQS